MSYIYPLNPCFYEVFEKYPILLKQIMGMEKEQKEMILMIIDAKSFVKSLQSFLSNEIICYEDDCICFEDSIEKKRYFLYIKEGVFYTEDNNNPCIECIKRKYPYSVMV